VRRLVTQKLLLMLVQLLEILKVGWILSDQSTLLQQIDLVREAFLSRKGLDIAHEQVVGNAFERVGHFRIEVLVEVDIVQDRAPTLLVACGR